MFFSAVWAFLMPNVSKSVYFHNDTSTNQPTTSTTNNLSTQVSKQPAAIEAKRQVIK